jgi:hypothetical protein
VFPNPSCRASVNPKEPYWAYPLPEITKSDATKSSRNKKRKITPDPKFDIYIKINELIKRKKVSVKIKSDQNKRKQQHNG